MFKNFFAINNPKLENLLKSTDFTIYQKQGLPLSYPRSQFLSDLDSILSKLDIQSKSKLLSKLQITELRDEQDNRLIGYDKILNLNFTPETQEEQKALELAKKFILQNRVITDNDELNNSLNSLIKGMPEFINIIGKIQQPDHDYSLDIHILTTLKEALNNPEYNSLSNIEKLCIKLAVILHPVVQETKKITPSFGKINYICATAARHWYTRGVITHPSLIFIRGNILCKCTAKRMSYYSYGRVVATSICCFL